MRDLEHKLQTAFCKWLRLKRIFHFAIPNGGARTAKTGKRLKDEGVLAGVPDLFIPAYKLFIELKSRTGKLSKEQHRCIWELESLGYMVAVCRSLEEAINVVERCFGSEA